MVVGGGGGGGGGSHVGAGSSLLQKDSDKVQFRQLSSVDKPSDLKLH